LSAGGFFGSGADVSVSRLTVHPSAACGRDVLLPSDHPPLAMIDPFLGDSG